MLSGGEFITLILSNCFYTITRNYNDTNIWIIDHIILTFKYIVITEVEN